MNASYIGSKLLATGQSAPFTGNWVGIAEARNALFVVYGSGISGAPSATIQAKTAFTNDPVFSASGSQQGVPLYTFSNVTNGYSTPAFLDSPVTHVRIAVPSGSGRLWCYAAVQN